MIKKYKIKLFLLLIFISIAFANYCYALEIPVTDWPTIPLTQPIPATGATLVNYIVYFFALGMYVAGVLALISLAIGGVQLILSAENPENRSSATGRIKGSVIGLLILLSAFIILGTINPKLQTIKTEPLNQLGGLQLKGSGNKSMPAPQNVTNLDALKADYGSIVWPMAITNTGGASIYNCDANNSNAVYVIYWFADYNFKGFISLTRMQCNNTPDSTLTSAKSYVIVKEQPGIYLYHTSNCTLHATGTIASGDDYTKIPQYLGTSLAQYDRSGGWFTSDDPIGSIRIVDGPDPEVGPFFGTFVFAEPDYKSLGSNNIYHLGLYPYLTDTEKKDDYSDCYATFGFPHSGSILVYQWGGFNADGSFYSDNGGVTLYSRSDWVGGKQSINDTNPNVEVTSDGEWKLILDQTVVHYDGTTIPAPDQANCVFFDPIKGVGGCLQSFRIDGNFLVFVSDTKDTSAAPHFYTGGKGQIFPISPRLSPQYKEISSLPINYSSSLGTPELATELITSANAKYMEIIPLAAPLFGS